MLEKKIRALEREIEKAEQENAAYDEKISAAATDFQELGRLMEEKAASDEALAALYAQWEELAALLEGQP